MREALFRFAIKGSILGESYTCQSEAVNEVILKPLKLTPSKVSTRASWRIKVLLMMLMMVLLSLSTRSTVVNIARGPLTIASIAACGK